MHWRQVIVKGYKEEYHLAFDTAEEAESVMDALAEIFDRNGLAVLDSENGQQQALTKSTGD